MGPACFTYCRPQLSAMLGWNCWCFGVGTVWTCLDQGNMKKQMQVSSRGTLLIEVSYLSICCYITYWPFVWTPKMWFSTVKRGRCGKIPSGLLRNAEELFFVLGQWMFDDGTWMGLMFNDVSVSSRQVCKLDVFWSIWQENLTCEIMFLWHTWTMHHCGRGLRVLAP